MTLWIHLNLLLVILQISRQSDIRREVCHWTKCGQNKLILTHQQLATELCIVDVHCVWKKVPILILSVTLSNLNRFSHFLHCWKAYEISYKTMRHSHLTLGVLLHYLGKLKIQIFGRLSTVSVSRNGFNWLLTPCFVQRFSGNSSVNLFAVYPFKYKLFIKILYSLLIAKVNKEKKRDMKNFICNQYVERHPIFKRRKYQNLWMNNNVRAC